MKKEEFRKELEKRFENYHFDIKEKEAIFDYYLKNFKESNEELENIYKKIIEENGKNLKSEIGDLKITKIMSAVSYAKGDNIITELPFEKDLRIFREIEDIYLLVNKDSEKNYQEIEKKLKTKSNNYKNNYKVHKIEVENGIVELATKIHSENINDGNTIIDLTLGMKIFSISLYKLACETGITVIDWVTPYRENIKKIDENNIEFEEKKIIAPFETKVEVMTEPKKESLRIKKKFNENLKKWNFKEVANFYRMIDNKENEIFFSELGEVINLGTMLNFNYSNYQGKAINFIETVTEKCNLNNEILQDITNYICFSLDQKNFEKFPKVKKKKFIKFRDESDDDNFDISEEEEQKNLKKVEEEQRNKLKNDENYLEKRENQWEEDTQIGAEMEDGDETVGIDYYLYLILNYLEKNVNNIDEGLFNHIKNIVLSNNNLVFLKDDFDKKTNKNIKDITGLKKIFKENIEEIRKLEFLEDRNFIENFKQKLDVNRINFKNGILEITKFDLKIDLYEFNGLDNFFPKPTKFKKDRRNDLNKNGDFLDKLINKNETNNITIYGSTPKAPGYKSSFKKEIGKINSKIKEKLDTKEDLIIVDKNKTYINEYFYKD